MKQYTQMIIEAQDERDAESIASAYKLLDDFVAYRILKPARVIDCTMWRVQVLIEKLCEDAYLPDGCRNVVVFGSSSIASYKWGK